MTTQEMLARILELAQAEVKCHHDDGVELTARWGWRCLQCGEQIEKFPDYDPDYDEGGHPCH